MLKRLAPVFVVALAMCGGSGGSSYEEGGTVAPDSGFIKKGPDVDALLPQGAGG